MSGRGACHCGATLGLALAMLCLSVHLELAQGFCPMYGVDYKATGVLSLIPPGGVPPTPVGPGGGGGEPVVLAHLTCHSSATAEAAVLEVAFAGGGPGFITYVTPSASYTDSEKGCERDPVTGFGTIASEFTTATLDHVGKWELAEEHPGTETTTVNAWVGTNYMGPLLVLAFPDTDGYMLPVEFVSVDEESPFATRWTDVTLLDADAPPPEGPPARCLEAPVAARGALPHGFGSSIQSTLLLDRLRAAAASAAIDAPPTNDLFDLTMTGTGRIEVPRIDLHYGEAAWIQSSTKQALRKQESATSVQFFDGNGVTVAKKMGDTWHCEHSASFTYGDKAAGSGFQHFRPAVQAFTWSGNPPVGGLGGSEFTNISAYVGTATEVDDDFKVVQKPCIMYFEERTTALENQGKGYQEITRVFRGANVPLPQDIGGAGGMWLDDASFDEPGAEALSPNSLCKTNKVTDFVRRAMNG